MTESVDQRPAVVDALYGFAEALDLKRRDDFAAVFAPGAVLDFSPGGHALGLDFPAIEGREEIATGILGALAEITTTHSVANPRVTVEGERATASALVEAQHLSADRERHLLLKNRYAVELERELGGWLIRRLTIDTVWWTGDPGLLDPGG
jgi:hypothetical protein